MEEVGRAEEEQRKRRETAVRKTAVRVALTTGNNKKIFCESRFFLQKEKKISFDSYSHRYYSVFFIFIAYKLGPGPDVDAS